MEREYQGLVLAPLRQEGPQLAHRVLAEAPAAAVIAQLCYLLESGLGELVLHLMRHVQIRLPITFSMSYRTKYCSRYLIISWNRICAVSAKFARDSVLSLMTQSYGNDCIKAFTNTICLYSIRLRADSNLSVRKNLNWQILGRNPSGSCIVVFMFVPVIKNCDFEAGI